MLGIPPVIEIAIGALLLVASTLVHGVGMVFVQRQFEQYWPGRRAAHSHRQFIFSYLVLLMLATHLVEVLLWAGTLMSVGAIPGLRDAFYYAAVTYTTLGYEDVKMPFDWRLLSPIMAMSGMFAFGWTTGVLVSLVAQARAEKSV